MGVMVAATAAITLVVVVNLDRTHSRPEDHVMAEPAVDSCAPVRMAAGPAPQEEARFFTKGQSGNQMCPTSMTGVTQ